jgi:hypothetical protein
MQKKRYQSADQLAIDLQRIIDGKPIGNGGSRNSSASKKSGTFSEEDYADSVDQSALPEASPAKLPASTSKNRTEIDFDSNTHIGFAWFHCFRWVEQTNSTS